MIRDEKQLVHDNIVYRFSSDWINKLETEEHWRHYWRQQKLMENRICSDDSILEIGVGTGFTANYLKSKAFDVTTVDIDEAKKPDIVANIVTYKPNKMFDHILAFQVFEHIPFEKFIKVIENLAGNCEKYVFTSIPLYKRRVASFEWRLPKLGWIMYTLTVPRFRLAEPHHHWELGFKGITKRKLIRIFSDYGFQLEHSETAFVHAFFAFRKV